MKPAWMVLVAMACSNKTTKESVGSAGLVGSNGATPTCVPGEPTACGQAGYKWTNAACCFDLPPNTKVKCDAGEATACTQAGGKWTGKLCCAEVKN